MNIGRLIRQERSAGGAVLTQIIPTANQLNRTVLSTKHLPVLPQSTHALIVSDTVQTSGAICARLVFLAFVNLFLALDATVSRVTVADVTVDEVLAVAMDTRIRSTFVDVCLALNAWKARNRKKPLKETFYMQSLFQII